MIKFIELESPSYDEGYHNCMERNGIIKSTKYIVNVLEISSINNYIGNNLHTGWNCSKVTMNNGNTFIDQRLPNELLNDISNL